MNLQLNKNSIMREYYTTKFWIIFISKYVQIKSIGKTYVGCSKNNENSLVEVVLLIMGV